MEQNFFQFCTIAANNLMVRGCKIRRQKLNLSFLKIFRICFALFCFIFVFVFFYFILFIYFAVVVLFLFFYFISFYFILFYFAVVFLSFVFFYFFYFILCFFIVVFFILFLWKTAILALNASDSDVFTLYFFKNPRNK